MDKKITVSKENRQFLAKAFKVTERSIWKALAYESNTDLAKKIRHLALQRGGVVVSVGQGMETMFDSDGYIRQYFPNGAMLEIKKGTDECDVFFKGGKVESCHVTFATIGQVQERACSLR